MFYLENSLCKFRNKKQYKFKKKKIELNCTLYVPKNLCSTQVQKLQAILKPMMLRRLKEDVEKKLAPKEETIIEVELTNIQKKYYRAILEKNFAFLSKGAGQANVPNLVNTMMELRKCCNHPYLIKGRYMRNQN